MSVLKHAPRLAAAVAARTAAAACAVTLLAAGCTVTSDRSAPASGSPGGGPSFAASAPGVTADSVRIGIVYPDVASVSQFVKLDYGDFEATYNALIADANAKGGINGRRIVPVYEKLDLLSPAAAQQTCVKLTQDQKVFAVVGYLETPDMAACYTQANRTAVVGGPLGMSDYSRTQAPWFSYDSGNDAFATSVRALSGHGDLTGRKIAVVANSRDETAMDSVVLPELKALGVTPVTTGVVPDTGNDSAALAQQQGVLLQKLQASGADTILLMGGVTETLPPTLEKSTWRPRLLFAGDPSNYLHTKAPLDFSELKDSVAAYPATDWNDPALQNCVTTVEHAIPSTAGKLVDPATVAAGDPSPGTAVQASCQALSLFTAIAGKAGRNLDYATFQTAGQNLGALHIPAYQDSASYTAQTPNGALPARVFTFDPASNRFVQAP